MIDYWNPVHPMASDLGDHDVPLKGDHLKGKKIALMITGGIAAFKAPILCRLLRSYQATVTVFMSQEALKYVTPQTMAWASDQEVVLDLTYKAEHLGGGHQFDLYLVAPATYNTINKFYHGIADNLITSSLASALGRLEKKQCQILIAPTMHGSMHTKILEQSLTGLQALDVGVIAPRDDYGKHNLPDAPVIVDQVIRSLSSKKLHHTQCLVTAGPGSCYIDNVRMITNKFTGQLGILIAQELYRAGAHVDLVLADRGQIVPAGINVFRAKDFYEYQQLVLGLLDQKHHEYGIFSAAINDYAPENVITGKMSSQQAHVTLGLKALPKIIDLVQKQHPKLKLISFKYQEDISHQELMNIAKDRLKKGHYAVVANRGEEKGPNSEQIAWWVNHDQEIKMVSKEGIAQTITQLINNQAGR